MLYLMRCCCYRKKKNTVRSKQENRKPLWKKAIAAIHDIYLGNVPKIHPQGKNILLGHSSESTGLNPNDYISLTSYTHHPFYNRLFNWSSRQLALGTILQPANWRTDGSIWQCHQYLNGYTIAWGLTSVNKDYPRRYRCDARCWKVTEQAPIWHVAENEQTKRNWTKKPTSEITVTQEERGKRIWQLGNYRWPRIGFMVSLKTRTPEYYMVKNSWGETANKRLSGMHQKHLQL